MTEHTEEPPKWLLLFSIDLAGATAFKIDPRHREKWPEVIDFFLRQTPVRLQEAWEKHHKEFLLRQAEFRQVSFPIGDAPVVWKSLGDELIFVAEIIRNSPLEILCATETFVTVLLRVIRDVEQETGGR